MSNHPSYFALAVLVLAAGCGSSSPTSPPAQSGGGPSSTQQCRSYAARYTTRTTLAGLPDLDLTTTCALNEQSASVTCTTTGVNGACTITQTRVERFQSLGDFIASGQVLGKTLIQSASFSLTAAGGAACINFPTAETTYTYDSQRRVTGSNQISPGGPSLVIRFSAWDNSGRPTNGTLEGTPACGSQPLTLRYDDANRSITATTGTGSGSCGGIAINRFDSNLNLIEIREQASGSVSTMTILESARVCR